MVFFLPDLVLLNNLPNPVYKQRYEEGMDHAKKFTWTCKLGYLSVEASHRTKKQAKHTSALLMIDNLQKELGDSFKTTVSYFLRLSSFCVEDVENKNLVNFNFYTSNFK